MDVRFGLADILRCGSYVRFTPESGHSIEAALPVRVAALVYASLFLVLA